MNEQRFGVNVAAGAKVVRGMAGDVRCGVAAEPIQRLPEGLTSAGGVPQLRAHVKCVAPDGTVRWEDEAIFFDPATTFRVDATPTAPEASDGSGRD